MKPKAKYDWSTKRWSASTELTEAELGLKGLAGLEATIREAIPRDEPLPIPDPVHVSRQPETQAVRADTLYGLSNLYARQYAANLQQGQYNLNMQNAFARQASSSIGQGLGQGFGVMSGLGLEGIFGR